MVRRYVSWVQVDEEGHDVRPEASRSQISVFEPDPGPAPTGLVDLQGNPLMRFDDRAPAGFVRFKTEG